MGSTLTKRLESIKGQLEDDSLKRIGFRRAFLLSIVGVILFCAFYGALFGPGLPSESEFAAMAAESAPIEEEIFQPFPDYNDPEADIAEDVLIIDGWTERTKRAVQDRIFWLHGSILGRPGAELYRSMANGIVAALDPGTAIAREQGEIPLFVGLGSYVSKVAASFLLRLTFVLIVGLPLWIFGAVAGLLVFRQFLTPQFTSDILGICSRKVGPFYSGIFGPLRANGTASATDFSCPGLACPTRATRSDTLKGELAKTLKEFGAQNEPNLDLAAIVISYGDFPLEVEEERISEEPELSPVAAILAESAPVMTTAVSITNKDGTLIEGATEGLKAILAAHQALQKYFLRKDAQISSPTSDEALFGTHRQRLESAAQKLDPLAASLLLSLTPTRGRAVAALPPTVIASAYLAIEAGKSLVYKRAGDGFAQISRFPHLQARAVIHSLLSYHETYSGDERMHIRQAIISARRHGDFGRAFLPMGMPAASRALRDWLEILYSARARRPDVANLVELDGHIEELNSNWRVIFARKLDESSRQAPTGGPAEFVLKTLWKGLPFKSVVLMPLKELLEAALTGISEARIKRITALMDLTRALHASVNISARLPGFKRQAVEAEKGGLESGGITKTLAERDEDGSMIERWLLVRRMLTRYNWLSTRIGDDAVPVDGLVQTIVVIRKGDKGEAVPMDAVVPIRQRRLREIFGARWEATYYGDAPHSSTVQVFVDPAEFNETATIRGEQAKNGMFNQLLGIDTPKVLFSGRST
ncbi:MAG: hypothetical protein IT290_03070 [Deltaproteobacteria bacterium]|nr:hypothetical protein [Deltaproteobacteria bacterium]